MIEDPNCGDQWIQGTLSKPKRKNAGKHGPVFTAISLLLLCPQGEPERPE